MILFIRDEVEWRGKCTSQNSIITNIFVWVFKGSGGSRPFQMGGQAPPSCSVVCMLESLGFSVWRMKRHILLNALVHAVRSLKRTLTCRLGLFSSSPAWRLYIFKIKPVQQKTRQLWSQQNSLPRLSPLPPFPEPVKSGLWVPPPPPPGSSRLLKSLYKNGPTERPPARARGDGVPWEWWENSAAVWIIPWNNRIYIYIYNIYLIYIYIYNILYD